jgi:hypothetical protein
MGFLRHLLGRDGRDAMDVWSESVPTSAPVTIDSGWDPAELRRRLVEAGAQVG